MSENEKIIKEKFAERADRLHDQDAADIPPAELKCDHVVEEREQTPFQHPENDAAHNELPALFQSVPLGRAGIDKKAALQKGGKGNDDQCDRVKNVDADAETLVSDDVDSEIEDAGGKSCNAEFKPFLDESPGEK